MTPGDLLTFLWPKADGADRGKLSGQFGGPGSQSYGGNETEWLSIH